MDEPRVTGASAVSHVRVLGPVGVVATDGTWCELPSASQRRLLAVLALQAGRSVRAESLGELLGLGPGALRKVVSRVRAVVGDTLHTSATGYRLEAAVDAHRFAEVVAAADRDGVDRAERLAEALGWWHGDALDEFAAEPWAMAEATRLDGLRARAVDELAGHWIAVGRSADALAVLEPQLDRQPFADRPRVLKMRALAAAGRSADAMRVAHRYRTELRDAVGLDAGDELDRTEQRIAGGWDGREPASVAPGSVSAVAGAAHPSIPLPATPRVGPTERLDAIVGELAAHRVVTLTGPGGVGKTRSAVDAAARAASGFRDGAVMIDLAPVADPVAVPAAVASRLGASTRAGLSVTASITERLAGSSMLLVLDNCEHVVAAAASLVRAIAADCPGITVLATSREPLGIRAEQVVPVHPLEIDDAVELFRERALAAGGRAIGHDALATVATLCHRLDCLPLAVELAAARSRSLSPDDLLVRLGDRFEVLGAARDGQYHQRTLWATIDWSYQLLDDAEQTVLDRLSVFHGTFELIDAEAVARSLDGGAPIVGAALVGLVDKSMVVAEWTGGSMRYRLLDTIRRFAAARLAERGELDTTAHRHLVRCVELAETNASRWFSPAQLDADAELDRAWDNLRAAHAWAGARHEHELAERLLLATIGHSQSRVRSEHGSWCATTVAVAEADGVIPSADLLGWDAWWSMIGGDLRRAVTRARHATEVATSRGSVGAVARSVLVFALFNTGQRHEADEHLAALEEAMDSLSPWDVYTAERALFSFSSGDGFDRRAARIAQVTEAIGAPALLASSRFYQGSAKVSGSKDGAAAAALHREGIELARRAGAELAECQNLQGLLDAELLLDSASAGEVCLEAVQRLYELRYWLYLGRVLDGAACVLARADETEVAGVLLGHLDRIGPPWRTNPRAVTRELVGAAGVPQAVLDRGATMDRDAVVALAIAALAALVAVRPS
ncbi:MAG: BTAD domain-containing putative transcriptional regulator [Acidimicrobiales bacterium]